MDADGVDWVLVDAIARRLRPSGRRLAILALGALRPRTVRFALAARRLAERTPDEIEAAGAASLSRLLSHAGERVPFYRGMSAERSTGLASFPVLRRTDLESGFVSLIARHGDVVGEIGNGAFYVSRTSGSTGVAVSHLKRHADEFVWDSALLWRIYRAHRIPARGSILDCGLRDPLDPVVSLTLVPGAFVTWKLRPFRLKAPGAKEEYLAILDRARPTVIHGAPSRVCELIDVVRRFDRPVRPRLVTVTYEELLPETAQAIEAELGHRPVSLYGTSELGLCAWQCSAGAFHFPLDATRVEVLTAEGDSAPPGTVGSLVITSLKSWAMPLIRYDTGDLAQQPSSPRCACGLAGQFVTTVEGRRDVRLLDSLGRSYLTYEPLGLLDSCGLVDFQVVQREPGRIRVVLPRQVAASDPRCERAAARLRQYFNDAMDIEFDASGAFRYTASGKRNALVTDVCVPRGSPWGQANV